MTSCLLYPVLFVFLMVLYLVKELTNISLKLKHGCLYGGMPSGGDCFWNVEEPIKNTLNILVTIETDTKDLDNFPFILKDKFCEKLQDQEDYPKFTYAVKRTAGYTYYLKNQINITDCISITNVNDTENITKDNLEDFLRNYSDRLLPCENKALWEIVIISKPFDQYNSNSKFPVLFRFNHIVADGLALSTVLSNLLGSFGKRPIIDFLKERYQLRNQNERKGEKDIITKVKQALSIVQTVLVTPAILMHQLFLRTPDVNILRRSTYSGERIFTYNVEEQPRLVNALKKMMQMLPGINFTDIIFTAISYSFYSYFRVVSNLISINF